jgi:hypothetical protein
MVYRFFVFASAGLAGLVLAKSPITVFTGQTETIAHLRQPTAMAMGQIVMGTSLVTHARRRMRYVGRDERTPNLREQWDRICALANTAGQSANV